MESTTNTTGVIGNLNQPLQSALFVPMESVKDKSATQGHRFARLIKRGENSKLASSVAIEVPILRMDYTFIQGNAVLAAYVQDALQSAQDNYLKGRSIAGVAQVQYDELTLEKLAEFIAQDAATGGGIGQLSEERIGNWFDNDGARDLLIVALADKLGVSETATPEEVKKLEQIANSTRDQLKKLASKKPVVFEERVKVALNKALDIVDTGDMMSSRLRDKLNLPNVAAIDICEALGM